MTVSTGVGGGSAGGVLVGGTGVGGGGAVIRELPFTGATEVMILVALGVLLLVAGILMLGLSKRHSPAGSLPPSSL